MYLQYQCVGDPDPQDPHVIGPLGSGSRSISQRYGSGSGLEQREILHKKIFTQNFSKKLIFKTENIKIMFLRVRYRITKKILKKIFFASLDSLKIRVGSGSGSRSISQMC